jgi:hypothetical protein
MLSCDQRFGINIGGSYYWVDEPLFNNNKRLFDSWIHQQHYITKLWVHWSWNSKAKDCHYWRCSGKDLAIIISWNQGMQKCCVFSLNWSMQCITLIEAFVRKRDKQFSNSKMNLQFILWHCCNHCGSSNKAFIVPRN